MLKVVEQQKQATLTDVNSELVPRAESLRRDLEHQVGVAQRREGNPEYAVFVVVGELSRGLESQARLPGPAWTGQG